MILQKNVPSKVSYQFQEAENEENLTRIRRQASGTNGNSKYTVNINGGKLTLQPIRNRADGSITIPIEWSNIIPPQTLTCSNNNSTMGSSGTATIELTAAQRKKITNELKRLLNKRNGNNVVYMGNRVNLGRGRNRNNRIRWVNRGIRLNRRNRRARWVLLAN